ncbi:MAG: DoxX family protein [Elusimicrobia bacterium]|nr:DoxX family protein [Elusimicrobiota bacterium]
MKIALGMAGRVVVGAAFIYSGYGKAVGPVQEFVSVLESYYLLPEAWLVPAATVLPWAQLILGVFLISGYLTRLSAAALGALLLAFIGAIGYTKAIGNPLDNCGCFGDLHFTPTQILILDPILIALAVSAFLYGKKTWSLDGWIEGKP